MYNDIKSVQRSFEMYKNSKILTETKLVTICLSPIKNEIFKDDNFGKIEYMQIVM